MAKKADSQDSPTVESLSGLAIGEEVTLLNGEPTGEVIVEDIDEDGNVVGWHKEVK